MTELNALLDDEALADAFERPVRRYKRYAEYRDSGIEWLGQVPKHREVAPLKRLGDLQGGAGFPEAEQGIRDDALPFFKVGDMGMPGNERQMKAWQHAVSIETAKRLRAFVFPSRTIAFAKVGAALLLNRRRLLLRPSCMDNNMMGFIPIACELDWAFYWLSGLDLGALANPGAIPSVNEGQMREIAAFVPSRQEQIAIAAFLTCETAKLDHLTLKKERLIELLEEKRSALITRAVTRGLDPNVPMKDSGVEWLGEIPAHWELGRLGRLLDRVEQGWSPNADERSAEPDEWVVIKLSAVRRGRFDDREHKVLPDESIAKEDLEIKVGDVLLTRANTPAMVGDACLVTSTRPKLMLCDLVYRLHVDDHVVSRSFLVWLLLSGMGRAQIEADARGTARVVR